MPVDPGKREQFLAWYASELEGEVISNEARGGLQARIPFLCPSLTWATTGGMRIGQTGRWFGQEGSGKSLTNLGLAYCAQNFPAVITEQYEREIRFLQEHKGKWVAKKRAKELKTLLARFPDGMSVAIFDAEGRFEMTLAQQIGLDTSKDKLEILYGNIIEEIVEAMKNAVEAYHLIILDSASSCESYEEASLEPGQYERGAAPRAWKRLKRLSRNMDKLENTFVIVDQVRTQLGKNMGPKGGTPLEPPNVRIIKHMASVAIEFSVGSKLYLDKNAQLTDDYDKASNDYPALGTKGKEPHGLEMRCKVIKNSTGRPYRNARMRFMFEAMDYNGEVVQETGFDHAWELLEAALEFRVIEQSGSYYYLLDNRGKRTKAKGMHGIAQATARIDEDEELAERIMMRLVQFQ